MKLRGHVWFWGAWDLLSCWRKDRAAVGKPRLGQAKPKLCLVVVEDVLFLVQVSFPSLLGTLRDND